MIKKWKILESKEVYSSPFVTLREEKLKMSEGKVIYPYNALERPNIVRVVAVTKNNEIVLIHEYKNGVRDMAWQLPAGFIDKAESPEKAAEREPLEETGYSTGEFVRLGSLNPDLGFARNRDNSFLAKFAKKVSSQKLDETEEIEVKTFSFDKVVKDIKERKSFLQEVPSQLAILLANEIL